MKCLSRWCLVGYGLCYIGGCRRKGSVGAGEFVDMEVLLCGGCLGCNGTKREVYPVSGLLCQCFEMSAPEMDSFFKDL